MAMSGLFEELKRRKVVRVAIAYVIVAWILIQVIISVEAPLSLPDWADTLIIVLLVAGFPVTLILAWVFDVTPGGIKKTSSEDPPQAAIRRTGESATDEPADAPSEKSIAVLPFVNMSSDPEQEYFSDGISEELLNQLTKLGGLRVAGRTSSFFFKGKNEDLRTVGEKLNVANILEGSVRKSGNRVRITAQLIKVADGYHLWSETFDRDLDDIFAIQDETARSVADALSVELGVERTGRDTGGTSNIEAYDAYLAGLAAYRDVGRRSWQKATALLEEAVSHDPMYADAWAILADVYDGSAYSFRAEQAGELTRKSQEAASRAVEIAPTSAAASWSSALLAMRNREWSGAERFLLKVLQVAPGDAAANYQYGRFLLYVGRSADAIRYCQSAVDADPLAPGYHIMLGISHQVSGNADEALKHLKQAGNLQGNMLFLYAVTVVLALEMQDRDLIDEYMEKLLSASGGDVHSSEVITRKMGPLLDSPQDALAELRRFDSDPAYDNHMGRTIITVWAAYFGDHELALKQFRELIDDRVIAFFIAWRPIQKGMRLLPGFKDILRKYGLVDYWRTSGNWGDFCRPVGQDDFEVYR
jgi:TolB-like protein/Tfp pilus assembly protein PilF